MTTHDGCTPICDYCQHYNFNGDEAGAYTDDGRCQHPDHPGPSEPDQSARTSPARSAQSGP